MFCEMKLDHRWATQAVHYKIIVSRFEHDIQRSYEHILI